MESSSTSYRFATSHTTIISPSAKKTFHRMLYPTMLHPLLLLLAVVHCMSSSKACGQGKVGPRKLLQDSSPASVEKHCGTDPLSIPQKAQLAKSVVQWKTANDHSQGRSLLTTINATAKIDIPVYFHILQFDETVGSLNPSTITQGFIPTLNKAYSETPFRFTLLNVTRTINRKYHNCSKGRIEYMFKSQLRRGGRNALNVYVCNAYGQDVAGWGTYPIFVRDFGVMDGVVVQNPELYQTSVSEYYTLVHETGHWLGLLHTFEDGCATAVDAVYYDDDDGTNVASYLNLVNDGVTDTPSHALPSDEYPGQSSCWQNVTLNTCNDTIPGMDVGLDPVDNYMNYIGSTCRERHGRFTPGQVERMVAEYSTYRHMLRQCRFQKQSCRKNGRCCIGLTCIRKRVDGVLQHLGTCGKCRWPGGQCFRHTDCCEGLYCQFSTNKCQIPQS